MTAFTRAAMRRRGMLAKSALLAQRYDGYGTSAPDDPSLVVGGKAPKKVDPGADVLAHRADHR